MLKKKPEDFVAYQSLETKPHPGIDYLLAGGSNILYFDSESLGK